MYLIIGAALVYVRCMRRIGGWTEIKMSIVYQRLDAASIVTAAAAAVVLHASICSSWPCAQCGIFVARVFNCVIYLARHAGFIWTF